jgi:GNAT superfamily N-acetyltransferase
MRLLLAQGSLLDEILDHTCPIWHEGLTRAAYGQWNGAQLRTPWGREHLHRFALVDDSGNWLATAKRYRYPVRLDGRDGWMCGIGAVFTPPQRRGHGYAHRLIDRLLDQERRDGALVAALFSEIGAEFYQRAGFEPVPLDEVTLRVQRKDYAVSKKRLLAGLAPPGLRHVEFFVAEEGAAAVAYVVISANQYGWTLEEAGDRDPSGARLGAILQVLVAREPTHRTPLIRTWWPPAFPVPPQLELTDRSEPRDIFMIRPLADVVLPRIAADVFYWRSDYF